jgi:hypothetical protein
MNILYIALICWTVIGAILFFKYADKLFFKSKVKEVVFYIISGPILWIISLVGLICLSLDFIDKLEDKFIDFWNK